jgi:AraC-like DNA-binding protein
MIDIAYDLGFADPAHLTRAVRAFTGAPPTFWRRIEATADIKCVQADLGLNAHTA